MTNWCHANSKKESNSENEVYVGNFEISDLDKSSINVFLTSKSLLRLATVSQKNLYIENGFVLLSNGNYFSKYCFLDCFKKKFQKNYKK